MRNALGRTLPDQVAGYGQVTPFAGARGAKPSGTQHGGPIRAVASGRSKVLSRLEDALAAAGARDGMTLSFHHHLRNGDAVLNMVVATAARLGLRNLTIAPSSIFPVHAPLVEHMRAGVVSGLDATYIAGPVARAVSAGMLERPVILRTHGGRARAIETGQLRIDIAFIAAPAADEYGNLNGTDGPAACGPLGYAFPDAEHAGVVVAVTDTLRSYPLAPISIPQTKVDHVVVVQSIGDPEGIASGTAALTRNPVDHKIAQDTARVIQASGLLKDGFSFQTGAGGASLASAHYVAQAMRAGAITGSFALGGISGTIVRMLEEGLFHSLFDVQSFDLDAVRSLARNARHVEIGSSFYANPFNAGCAVNRLDAVVLGATEIDLDFNVNVVTGSTGLIMGGSGGHADAAAGAALTVVVAKLVRKRLPIVVGRALTATTPGESIDVLVTERGIAVNPARPELAERLRAAGLAPRSIAELRQAALALTGVPEPVPEGGKIVALVEYRDGTIIDVVRQSLA